MGKFSRTTEQGALLLPRCVAWMDMSLSKLRELVMNREAWRAACGSWGPKESEMTE